MTIESIFIIIALALTALALLTMLIFGVRNLTYGKQSIATILLIFVPLLLLVILGFVMGDWAQAGVLTTLIMLVLALGGLAVSGLRGIFG